MNIIDDFNREILAIEVGRSINSRQLLRKLDELVDFRGKPQFIRSDNGPEYISRAIQEWAEQNEVEWKYIQPGKPTRECFCGKIQWYFASRII